MPFGIFLRLSIFIAFAQQSLVTAIITSRLLNLWPWFSSCQALVTGQSETHGTERFLLICSAARWEAGPILKCASLHSSGEQIPGFVAIWKCSAQTAGRDKHFHMRDFVQKPVEFYGTMCSNKALPPISCCPIIHVLFILESLSASLNLSQIQ